MFYEKSLEQCDLSHEKNSYKKSYEKSHEKNLLHAANFKILLH